MIRSATAAYRLDCLNRPGPFGSNDGAWVAVASLLEQAALLGGSAAELVRAAVELTIASLGEKRLARDAQREFGEDERHATDAVLLLSDQAYQAGAPNIAYATLQALVNADRSLGLVQRGRVLVRMARIKERLGFLDEAKDQLGQARRLAKRAASDELRVRVLIGLGGLAQSRGNYPEMHRYLKRAALLADRARLSYLARFAHSGLMIVAAERRDFHQAFGHAAIVYRQASGHPIEEGEILQNIGQLLLVAGHAELAEAFFTAVLTRQLPERIVLAALGGLALAAAKRGNATAVRWAATEVERLHKLDAQRYQVAIALLECAIAMTTMGEAEIGDRLRRAALTLGEADGYYEVVVRADMAASEIVASESNTRPLESETLDLARAIRAQEPEQLPEHVMVATPG